VAERRRWCTVTGASPGGDNDQVRVWGLSGEGG
jgi:hypothetical protein